MSRFIEMIRRIIQQELSNHRSNLLGVITSVFPHETKDDENNYEANVRLKHEDLELRKVPLAVGHIGVATPPRVDDLVMVHFINGDINQPVISGRFYHADDRPPLHHEDEILFEQRVPDGTLNHLRFTSNGTIYLQRDVTKPENNSEAKTSVKIDGESGDIEIKAGDAIKIVMTHNDNIAITAKDKQIDINCATLTVNGNVDVKGDLKVESDTGSTTMSGNTVTGG